MRRRGIAALVAIAAVIALLFWLRRGDDAAAHVPTLHVALSAQPSSMSADESSALSIAVTSDGQPVAPADCTITWTSDGGGISGAQDFLAVFTPSTAGLYRASVTVQHGGQLASATVQILVVASASEAGSSTASDKPDNPAPPPAQMDGPPPIIDSIVTDKKEICRGEWVTVTVKAHDPRGADYTPWLNYLVDGNAGQAVPVFFRGDDKNNNPHYVTVYGKDNKTWVTEEVPAVTIKNCEVSRIARIAYELLANTEADFHFRAEVETDPAAAPFVPKTYSWDFGDGTKTTTTEPFVDHSYAHRKQDTAYASFLVSVEMEDAAGEKQVAKDALTLANFAFQMRDPSQKHYVALMVEMTPRYPERAPDGTVHQTAWIWHNDKKPVTITEVHEVDYTTEGDELRDRDVEPEDLLGTRTLAPAGVKVPLAMSSDDADYVQYRTWYLAGKAADGVDVYGSVTLMVPGKIDRKTSPTVDDEAMKQRIVTAMKILGKKPGETISDEDLLRLEEQGLLPHYDPPDPSGNDTTQTPSILDPPK